MNIIIREYAPDDIPAMTEIWNEVVDDGIAFPQEDFLNEMTARSFFGEQTYTAVAVDNESGDVLGLYILHPNNVGRCGHICNASFAVKKNSRGLHIGKMLVRDCIDKGSIHGFRILQFNAVVESNVKARRLYERLGFIGLGVIPDGFRMKDGHYEGICPYYRVLQP